MSLASQKLHTRQIHAGQNGYTEISGIAAFSTTDANGELNCLIQNVQGITITPIGPVATDETIYVDEAAQVTDNVIIRPASGTLTIARTGASKTSGLKFAFRYWGY